jgi:glycosyltransferase domain-containing protein
LLTLLMPLKGRHLHTLRFLWHLDRQGPPVRMLIADGEVHPTIARLMEDRSVFGNVEREYIRYPNDRSYADYFKKMRDAVARVRTPYVMVVDNDDFVSLAGVARCVKFLEENPDYVCCGARIVVFELVPASGNDIRSLTGSLASFNFRYLKEDARRDVGAPSAAERVLGGFINNWTAYSVFRTEALLEIWRDIERLHFTDLYLMELFRAMRTFTLGKGRWDETAISYLRQYDTSLRSDPLRKWAHLLLGGGFIADCNAMIDRISELIAASDGVAPDAIGRDLREACGDWLWIFLGGRPEAETIPPPAPSEPPSSIAGAEPSASPPGSQGAEPPIIADDLDAQITLGTRRLGQSTMRRVVRWPMRVMTRWSPRVVSKLPEPPLPGSQKAGGSGVPAAAALAIPAPAGPAPRLSPADEQREGMFYYLRARGAAEDYLEGLRTELALVDSVLTGAEFREFLGRHAGELMPRDLAEPAAATAG